MLSCIISFNSDAIPVILGIIIYYSCFINGVNCEKLNNIHMVTLKVSGDLNLSGRADSKIYILSNYSILAEYLRLMVMHIIPLCIWALSK